MTTSIDLDAFLKNAQNDKLSQEQATLDQFQDNKDHILNETDSECVDNQNQQSSDQQERFETMIMHETSQDQEERASEREQQIYKDASLIDNAGNLTNKNENLTINYSYALALENSRQVLLNAMMEVSNSPKKSQLVDVQNIIHSPFTVKTYLENLKKIKQQYLTRSEDIQESTQNVVESGMQGTGNIELRKNDPPSHKPINSLMKDQNFSLYSRNYTNKNGNKTDDLNYKQMGSDEMKLWQSRNEQPTIYPQKFSSIDGLDCQKLDSLKNNAQKEVTRAMKAKESLVFPVLTNTEIDLEASQRNSTNKKTSKQDHSYLTTFSEYRGNSQNESTSKITTIPKSNVIQTKYGQVYKQQESEQQLAPEHQQASLNQTRQRNISNNLVTLDNVFRSPSKQLEKNDKFGHIKHIQLSQQDSPLRPQTPGKAEIMHSGIQQQQIQMSSKLAETNRVLGDPQNIDPVGLHNPISSSISSVNEEGWQVNTTDHQQSQKTINQKLDLLKEVSNIDKFVELMKYITTALVINIFNQDLDKIYIDPIYCIYREKFGKVLQKQVQKFHHNLQVKYNDTQAKIKVNTTEKYRSKNDSLKDMVIADTLDEQNYQMKTNFFAIKEPKKYDPAADEDVDFKEFISDDLNHLVLKLGIHEGQLDDDQLEFNLQEGHEFVILQIIYPTSATPFFIFMFKNIAQKFLISDTDLRRELKSVLQKQNEQSSKIVTNNVSSEIENLVWQASYLKIQESDLEKTGQISHGKLNLQPESPVQPLSTPPSAFNSIQKQPCKDLQKQIPINSSDASNQDKNNSEHDKKPLKTCQQSNVFQYQAQSQVEDKSEADQTVVAQNNLEFGSFIQKVDYQIKQPIDIQSNSCFEQNILQLRDSEVLLNNQINSISNNLKNSSQQNRLTTENNQKINDQIEIPGTDSSVGFQFEKTEKSIQLIQSQNNNSLNNQFSDNQIKELVDHNDEIIQQGDLTCKENTTSLIMSNNIVSEVNQFMDSSQTVFTVGNLTNDFIKITGTSQSTIEVKNFQARAFQLAQKKKQIRKEKIMKKSERNRNKKNATMPQIQYHQAVNNQQLGAQLFRANQDTINQIQEALSKANTSNNDFLTGEQDKQRQIHYKEVVIERQQPLFQIQNKRTDKSPEINISSPVTRKECASKQSSQSNQPPTEKRQIQGFDKPLNHQCLKVTVKDYNQCHNSYHSGSDLVDGIDEAVDDRSLNLVNSSTLRDATLSLTHHMKNKSTTVKQTSTIDQYHKKSSKSNEKKLPVLNSVFLSPNISASSPFLPRGKAQHALTSMTPYTNGSGGGDYVPLNQVGESSLNSRRMLVSSASLPQIKQKTSKFKADNNSVHLMSSSLNTTIGQTTSHNILAAAARQVAKGQKHSKLQIPVHHHSTTSVFSDFQKTSSLINQKFKSKKESALNKSIGGASGNKYLQRLQFQSTMIPKNRTKKAHLKQQQQSFQADNSLQQKQHVNKSMNLYQQIPFDLTHFSQK